MQDTLPGMPEVTYSLPKVDGMEIPFEWTDIQDIIGCPSIDVGYCPEHDELDSCLVLTNEFLTEEKRSACNYEGLLNSIREVGFLDPIDFDGHRLGNGHHRLAVAIDCGYTHVPTTDNPIHAYRHSGNEARELD